MSDPSHVASAPPPGELRQWAATLKHDLGKYVAWRSANLPETSWSGEIDDLTVASIRADVLATREHDGRSDPAWAVFEERTRDWPAPWPRELEVVASAVAALRELAPVIAGDDRAALAAARPAIRAAQSTIRAELAALGRRLVQEA